MGRSRRSKRAKILDWRFGLGTLVLVVTGTAVPVLGIIWLAVMSSLPDLAELVVRSEQSPSVTDWPSLNQRPSGSHVRILGYMMDDEKPIPNGSHVRSFTLMPESGNLLHPAHCISEEMIVVRLRDSSVASFTSRLLVWVEGTLNRVVQSNQDDQPLYELSDAMVQVASERDVQRYYSYPASDLR